MRKLLIVPAILAMTSLSGSAFAQHVGDTVGIVGTGSGTLCALCAVGNTGNINQGNASASGNLAGLNVGGQSTTTQQSNFGDIGIGASSNFVGH
jgi:hypothetical protein